VWTLVLLLRKYIGKDILLTNCPFIQKWPCQLARTSWTPYVTHHLLG